MSIRPLRICLLAPLPPPYGGIAHWTTLLVRFTAARDDVQLSVINIEPTWRSIQDMRVWRRVLGGSVQLLRDCCRLVARLLGERPDVVHLTTSGRLALVRDLAVGALAKLFGLPLVYHLHFGRTPDIAAKGAFEWRLLRRAISMSHLTLALDAATEESLHRHLPRARVERLPNCIATSLEFRALETCSDRIALFLGHVIPSKGISTLLEAWSLAAMSGWTLSLVGPCDPRYQTDLIREFPSPSIHFIGELAHSEALRAMEAAAIFVLPSYTEGFPNVVLEAMAFGKPIIASAVGAIPEMLADGCGVTVPSGDALALAGALRSLAPDEALRHSLGRRARDRASSRYSEEAVFSRLLDTWKHYAIDRNRR